MSKGSLEFLNKVIEYRSFCLTACSFRDWTETLDSLASSYHRFLVKLEGWITAAACCPSGVDELNGEDRI